MAWQPLASTMRSEPRIFSAVLQPVKRSNAVGRPVRDTRRAMPRLEPRAIPAVAHMYRTSRGP